MRDHAPGRHARHKALTLRHYLLALLASVAALVTALAFTAPSKAVTAVPAAHQARAVTGAPGQDRVNKADLTRAVTAARTAAARHAASVLAAHTYLVRGGDSISGVAVRKCAAARDWTGIYAASRAYGWTGRNANQITAGQKLYLLCAYDAAQLKFAAAPAAPVHATAAVPAASTTRHDRFDGQHGACGDGDGDGMDASCAVIFPQSYQSSRSSGSSLSYHRTYHAAVSGSSYASSGTYSYAGLEALWISAGGPAWAAAHAASIAECESGGRTSAYNPSGATGLWQILGSVVGGNLYNAYTNALNAVAKFKASGDTFAQWVCT